MNGEKEGPGKFIYKSKRQMYEGQWSNGIPKCGTIVDITELPIYPKRKYPIPPVSHILLYLFNIRIFLILINWN